MKEWLNGNRRAYIIIIGGLISLSILFLVFWQVFGHQSQEMISLNTSSPGQDKLVLASHDSQNLLGQEEEGVGGETSHSHQASEDTDEGFIYVDIKGEVEEPGVYSLPQGSRLFDLIDQAGGLTAESNQKLINQALILEDQSSVYIPSIYDQETPDDTSADLINSADSQAGDKEQVNINTADQTSLETLPNIGPSKAQAIIQFREENGSFTQKEQLMEVPGIGQRTYDRLVESICL